MFFMLSFTGWFVLFVFLHRYFSIRGENPLSWHEIYDDLLSFLLMSFGGAIFFTCMYLIDKYDKPKK
jgi:hypothetical protein